MKLCNINHDNN